MGLTLLTPPDDEPVTLIEAKAQCRVLHSDEDTYIETLISAAARYVERYVGRSLTERQWKLTLDEFSDSIELPMGPVTAIDAVEYVDADGDTIAIDAANYTLDSTSEPQWLVRNSAYNWPGTLGAVNVVSVTYTAGFATLPAQYADLKIAVLLLIGHWYRNREAVSEGTVNTMPLAVEALAGPYRLPTVR